MSEQTVCNESNERLLSFKNWKTLEADTFVISVHFFFDALALYPMHSPSFFRESSYAKCLSNMSWRPKEGFYPISILDDIHVQFLLHTHVHTWKWIERYTIWKRIGSPSLWKLRREDSEIELVSEVLGSLHIINSSDVRRKSHMLSSIDIHRYEMHAYEPALYVVCTNNSFTSIFSCKSSKQWAHIFTNLQA